MELFLDLIKVLFRVVTILPLMLAVTLFMGKRSIGELPVFDFLVILTLGSVVGADIADPSVHHFPTVGAIIGIGLLQKFIAWWKIKNYKIGRLLSFEPTLVIFNGHFQIKNMYKISYSIDNILQMLRQKNVFRVEDVHFAIIEANGDISVKLKPEKEGVIVEQIVTQPSKSSIEFAVILEGRIQQKVLQYHGLNEAWLREELLKLKIMKIEDVFYAAVNERNHLHISMRNSEESSLPIFH
ncbi:DUF421 domain-containing protein [Sutcliffiella rhizosphaerae]|uniref:YetF C-terminal domain-containing protein n=1 Tax=Sutcliffiella rhizosphaerae TaxID=2880967 RepID=A0ABN8AIN3_9BACI|nr:DUF421 domain-containing protein [Sutcliffiella rhizosphaerae]CAG9622973.1 hypothetical protein BACCIP111883_03768 [Sutcliffiella rhizosphaerae]